MKAQTESEDKDYFKDIHFLYSFLREIGSKEEIKHFLSEILTKSELIMLKKRWHIANLLNEGFEIREVALRSKAGTNTVLKIKAILEKENSVFQAAIENAQKTFAEDEKKNRPKKFPSGSSLVKNWFK